MTVLDVLRQKTTFSCFVMFISERHVVVSANKNRSEVVWYKRGDAQKCFFVYLASIMLFPNLLTDSLEVVKPLLCECYFTRPHFFIS